MTRICCLMLTMLILSGCSGMSEAYNVLPDTMDDLAQKTKAFRHDEDRQTKAGAGHDNARSAS